MKKIIYFFSAMILFISSAVAQEIPVTIAFQTENRMNVPNFNFKMNDASGGLVYEGTTNNDGVYLTKLKKGGKYTLSSNVPGGIFTNEFTVPTDVDYYFFNAVMVRDFKEADLVDPSRPTKALSEAPKELVKEGLNLILKVIDDNGVNETDARILVMDKNTKVFQGTTNVFGECYATVNAKTPYEVYVYKFGKTFRFDMNLNENLNLYKNVFTMAIKVVDVYGDTYVLENVWFDFNQATLRPKSKTTLNKLYETLKSRPEMRIELAGHTDNIGSDEYNMVLSQKRANAVKEYLVNKGISADRLLAKGYGESQPVATNDTDQGRQENRRTEVKEIER